VRPVDVAIAVDVGGTKLACAVVDGAGAIVRRSVRATPVSDDAEVVWEALVRAIDDMRVGVDAVVCGVGCGGPMGDDGAFVSPLHIPAWRDFALRDRLERHIGVRAFVDNDAKAVALAEGWLGAAAGQKNFLGMVVSTGIGGGLVVDGRLLPANAGHIGHVIVRPDGRSCRCGGRGCLEAEASGTAIAERTGHPAADASPEVIADAGTLVGRAVACVVNALDVRLAVVAGSAALGWGAPFFAAAQAELDQRARLSFSEGARVVPAALGADAPLVGAAAIGWHGRGAETQRHPA
jgi:glucokinase